MKVIISRKEACTLLQCISYAKCLIRFVDDKCLEVGNAEYGVAELVTLILENLQVLPFDDKENI